MLNDLHSNEAALKYFILGAAAIAVMLDDALWVLPSLWDGREPRFISDRPELPPTAASLSLLAAMLILVGFGFKATLVPFHMWAPDTYQGVPTTVTTFPSGPQRGGARGPLATLFDGASRKRLTMAHTVGDLIRADDDDWKFPGALRQTHLKRLLAYSSIAQAGFLLMALTSDVPSDSTSAHPGISAFLFYLMGLSLDEPGGLFDR